MRKRQAATRSASSAVIGLLILLLGATTRAASFTPGDIVVYRVGDGASSLINTGNAVFLDEYTPAGALVQSIGLPTTADGSNNQLIASGTANSEGLLTRSANGQYVLLTGYARDLGRSSSLSGTASTAVPRTVGRIKFDGSIDTSTALTDFASSNNPRSAGSTDGLDIWVAGAAGGVRYARYSAFGSTSSTQLSTDSANIEQVEIFDGQLYVSSQKNGIIMATVGTGEPTTGGQALVNLSGIAANTHVYAFFFASLSAGTVLYAADDTTNGGQILKYSLVNGTWTPSGSINAPAARGLTGVVSSSTVTLYATTGASTATGGGTLYSFSDTTGYNATVSGTATSLVTLTTSSNETFRGVALAPVNPNSPTQTPIATDTATSAPSSTSTPTLTASATSTPTQTPTTSTAPTQAPTAVATSTPIATDTPILPATVSPTPPNSPSPTTGGMAFTPGDIVVYRIGDGTTALTNNGNAVFLDEYSISGGTATLVQSVGLPTTASGAQNQLIATSDVSEGLLARSTDGQYILLTGYGSNLGGSTALATTAATAVPRTVGRVKYDGTIDTSTALTDMSSANNVRSAISTNGTDIWVGGASGSSGGIHYTTLGSTTSTQLFGTIPKGVRQANIFGGQLYFDSNATGFLNVSTLGVGTPTMGGQSGTELPGLPDSAGNDGYLFADLSDGHGLATLYVANDSLGEILKYALGSGSWTASGTITAANVHGVTGVVSGTTVTLYASGTTGTDGTLYTFTDSSGYNGVVSGTATSVATAVTDEAFRGVALVPVNSNSPEATPTMSKVPTQVSTVVSTPTRTPIVVDTLTPTATMTPTPSTPPASTPTGKSFTPGDIVVYRIGDGTTALTNNGNAVFLDEYSISGGTATLVQSVGLPTTASGAQNQLIATSDVSEGLLARSTDGQYILLTGYGSNLGGSTALATTAATAVPRTVGRVKYDGTIDTSTALTDMSSANNVRSAISTNGTDIWVGGASGSSGGIHYTTLGSTTSTQLFGTIPKGVRQANIFGGQLYFDSNATGFLNVSTLGVGTPTMGGQSGTELPGLPDSAGNDGYLFADLSDGHGLATLYVANDSLGEILKYALVSGSWTASGTITAANVHGVTGVVSGTTVTLYASGTTGTDGTLYTFTDSSGYNGVVSGTATNVATAVTDEAFRGVALVPVASVILTTTPTHTPEATATAMQASTATATPLQTLTATATPEQTPSMTDTPAQLSTITGTPSHVPTATPTPTPSATEIPTATGGRCIGDCDGSGDVTVDELIAMVNIALGDAPLSDCTVGDADTSGEITIDEIIGAINNALNGCPRG